MPSANWRTCSLSCKICSASVNTMGLDIKTLFIADVAVLLVSAIVSLLFWYRDRDGDWLLWWTAGTASSGLAMLVLGVSGPVLRPVVGVPAASLFFAGFLMVWQSMRRLHGRPAVWGWAIALVAFVAMLSGAVMLGADLHERAGLLLAALAFAAMVSAWEVAFGSPALWRSRLPLAAMFFVMGSLLATTAVVTGLRGHAPVVSFADLLGGNLPLVNSVALLGVCFYIMLIINERTRTRYRQLASTDELTGLPNRRFFMEEASRRARGSSGSVLMMDLDYFSEVNRRFGHAGGDRALKAFADAVRQGLRTTDVVGRYGGEEFCAFLVATETADAIQIAERLRETVAGLSIISGGRPLRITVSIGIAALRKGDLEASINDADEALYRAKSQGRNRLAVAGVTFPKSANSGGSKLRVVR
jgi:diguanylate cyclase (GGDEF)-like protein